MIGHNYGNKICLKCSKIHVHPRGMLGKVPWNKGLNKETDERIRKYGKTISIVNKGNERLRKFGEKNPNYGKHWKWPEEIKRKMALSKLGDKNPARDPRFIEDYRKRIKSYLEQHDPPMKGKKHSEKAKLKIKLNHWSRKVYQSEEIKKEFFRKMIKNIIKKPNKKEILLNNILQTNFPNEWEYTGDGRFWIGNKCPDFINMNERKLIELFGDYWHTKKIHCVEDTEDGRENYFQRYGYCTLIIWENELKDIGRLKEKIIKFMVV